MKILFEHQHLYYLPQFEPMIKLLRMRGHDKLYGSICESVSRQEKDAFKENMDRLGVETIQANYEPQRCRIIKNENFELIFIGNRTSLNSIAGNDSFVVMIYHGIGLKNSYYTDLTDRIDLIAVESSLRAEKLGDLGYTTVDSGFIKLDHFPQLTHDEKRACQQEMRIEPGKPTILYAPTFYPSSLKKTIPIIPDLVSEMNVIIKLHQFNWIMPKYLPLKEKLLSMEKKLERLTLVGFDKVNILDLFPLADLLVSDFSSTLFEFLPWDKPIIHTAYYSPRLKHLLFPQILDRRMDKDRIIEADFMYNCSAPGQLLGLITDVLEKDDQHQNKNKDVERRFLGKVDGRASERLLKAITSCGLNV